LNRIFFLSCIYLLSQEIIPIISKNSDESYEVYYGLPDDKIQELSPRLSNLYGYSLLHFLYSTAVPRVIQKWLKTPLVPEILTRVFLSPSSYGHKVLMKSPPKFEKFELFPHPYNDPTVVRTQSPSFGVLTNSKSVCRIFV
jgi:hypothetical protein